MRAVWWREQRELLVPALAVCVAMALLGAEFARDGIREDGLAILGLIGGGFGLFQGLLDRARKADGFLLHRPLSVLRVHVARSFAGFAALAFGVASAVGGGAWWTWREAVRAQEAGGGDRGSVWSRGTSDPWRYSDPWRGPRLEFDAGGLALAVGILVAGYVVARFATSRRRIPVAVFAVAALGIAGWSLVARFPDVGAAAVAAVAFACVVFAWLLLDLAGERR